MRSFIPAILALAPLIAAQSTASSKRGLCYVPSTKYPGDDDIWDNSTSDLTWYYNYQASPSAVYQGSKLQFVPMLWGNPTVPATDMSFYNTVKGLIQGGMNITYVLGKNPGIYRKREHLADIPQASTNQMVALPEALACPPQTPRQYGRSSLSP